MSITARRVRGVYPLATWQISLWRPWVASGRGKSSFRNSLRHPIKPGLIPRAVLRIKVVVRVTGKSSILGAKGIPRSTEGRTESEAWSVLRTASKVLSSAGAKGQALRAAMPRAISPDRTFLIHSFALEEASGASALGTLRAAATGSRRCHSPAWNLARRRSTSARMAWPRCTCSCGSAASDTAAANSIRGSRTHRMAPVSRVGSSELVVI